MRMMTRASLSTLAVSATISLGSDLAAAQGGDVQTQVEDLQQRYEEAVAAGDSEAVGSLFTENAILAPISGGMFEGREEVQGYHEQLGLEAVDVRSSKTEAVGESMILDIGTFTGILPQEAGGTTLEGEYVVLAEEGEDGMRIRSLTSFPVRQAPGASGQQ